MPVVVVTLAQELLPFLALLENKLFIRLISYFRKGF